MQVFRIRLDSNRFQSLLPRDPAVWSSDSLIMDCNPKLGWHAPPVYVPNPKLRKGSFLHLCSGAFVADETAVEVLRTQLEMAGELLPIPVEDRLLHLINILECVNCLDHDRTQWVYGKATNARIRVAEYHFDARRFSEATLFKIPETAKAEVLTVVGLKDAEDGFKEIVERTGLEGIVFELLWSST
jgi:hypothetical protein